MPIPDCDFLTMLETLARHRVDFIVVGGVCAVLQGAPLSTFDLDVVHSRTPDNLQRLLAALQELDAIYREQPHRRLRPGLSHLASSGHQLLLTTSGWLDVLATLSGDRGYDELLPHTVEGTLSEGLKVRLLNLATLIVVKEEAGRDKDKAVLPILRRTLEEKEQL
jgi:hypothetical protein